MTTSSLAETIQKTIAFVQNNPSSAMATYRAEVRWDHGTQCSGFVRKFEPLVIDEPPSLGGNDAGMNPVELLLVSLGACQEIAYSLFASVMGIQIDAVQVKVKGQLDVRGIFGDDKSIPPGYQGVTFETKIDSPADADTIKALVEAVESGCPTLDTFRRPVPVTGEVFLNGTPVTSV